MQSTARAHPKTVGDQTTTMVLARLVQAYPDASVLVPFGENCRYDLLIDHGDRFVRVQCKTGRLRDGVVLFGAFSTTYHHPNNQGMLSYKHNYRGQADVFGVYCPETDAVYVVPVDVVGTTDVRLRLDPTRNKQTKKIRWARDYELKAPG